MNSNVRFAIWLIPTPADYYAGLIQNLSGAFHMPAFEPTVL